MFGIGPGEFVIICVVLIIAVGPERLPQFMKTVGGTLRTLRQASRDIRTSVGIDEMMRPDPPPRPKPRTPPAQTQPRAPAAPSTGAGEADSVLTTVQAKAAAPAPAAPAPATPAPATPAPAMPNQLLSPEETITSSDVTALFKAAHRPAPAPVAAPPAAPPPAASTPAAAPASESGELSAPAPGAPPAPTGER